MEGLPSKIVKNYYLLSQGERIMDANPVSNTPASVRLENQKMQDQFWPNDDPFIQVSEEKQVHENRARLIRYATLNNHGQSMTNFKQGETAHFYYEFQAFSTLEMPLGGIVLKNDLGINVHGKNSLQFDAALPGRVEKGSLIRFHQQITLNISAGEYSFEFGLVEISPQLYDQRSFLPYQALAASMHRLCHVPQAGSLAVSNRLEGTPSAFMHYGLCDLPGQMEVQIVP
jgi:lipopolysaccharide transport system ATP-binding protein